MKTAISIPDDLFESGERAARKLGVSRSELYQRALAAFLEQHDGRALTDALNQVYASDAQASSIDPVLGRLQRASLPREAW